jgi:hypothetical protein
MRNSICNYCTHQKLQTFKDSPFMCSTNAQVLQYYTMKKKGYTGLRICTCLYSSLLLLNYIVPQFLEVFGGVYLVQGGYTYSSLICFLA